MTKKDIQEYIDLFKGFTVEALTFPLALKLFSSLWLFCLTIPFWMFIYSDEI